MSLGKAPPPHGAELGDPVDTGRPGVSVGGGSQEPLLSWASGTLNVKTVIYG